MAEKETIFSTSMSYGGIFNFGDYYQFCYDWLTQETELEIFSEDKYAESIKGNEKELEIKWTGKRKVTDYFMFEIKIKFEIAKLTEVEVEQDGKKIKTNKGKIKTIIKGALIRDYDGKFEKDALRKFLRAIYEKWIIASRIDQLEGKLVGDCEEFLGQAKAYLALEGKR